MAVFDQLDWIVPPAAPLEAACVDHLLDSVTANRQSEFWKVTFPASRFRVQFGSSP